MIAHLPRRTSGTTGPDAHAHTVELSFEAALRRDLQSGPIFAYEAVVGGWLKRAFDIVFALLALILAAPFIGVAALIVKLLNRAPVFSSDERLGYGGRSFKRYRMRLLAPSAEMVRLHQPGDAPLAPVNDNPKQHLKLGARLRRAGLEKAPQLLNVLSGRMSLVGPAPLTRDGFEQLSAGKRYYLSARPGLISLRCIEGEAQPNDEAPLYKLYVKSWSPQLDLRILALSVRDALRRGFN